MIKVLYFGIYDPSYSRNRVLLKGLRENNLEVIECREDPRKKLKFIRLLFRYLRMRLQYDVMIVGFPGQEIMFLARILTGKPIIFDAFTSHYGGHILDRKKWPEKSLHAKYFRFMDRWSCKLADIVLLDTNAHINFFVKEFNLPVDKFRRIFVGTDSSIFYPRQGEKNDNFLVHFHGYYIPLQGVEYIIQAAKLLEKENIFFNLIGRGQTYEKGKKIASDLNIKNINFMDKVSYKELSEYVAKADICLGVFGNTPKTQLVIPNKIFEAMAMKKPIITADTLAMRELLNDEDALLIKTADSQSIAEGILRLKGNPDLRNKIAENSYRKFVEFAEPSVLGRQLVKIIEESI